MGSKQSKYHHGDLRRMLIRTAEEIIAHQGLEAFTLRQLSKRIGVSHTAVYRHFKNKHELFCALSLEGFKEAERRLKRLKAGPGRSPLEVIRATGQVYVEFALENPARYRVMFGHVLLNQERPPELRQAARQTFGNLLNAIEQGQEMGLVRAGDPLELTGVGWAMAHGICQLLIDGQLMIKKDGQVSPALLTFNSSAAADQDTKRYIETALDAMTAGLMKPGSG